MTSKRSSFRAIVTSGNEMFVVRCAITILTAYLTEKSSPMDKRWNTFHIQSKVLRIIVNAPWFVLNRIFAHGLKIKTVKSEIRDYYVNYNKRLENHPNVLANHLLTNTNTQRRLKRYTTYDLATRFN
jgi:hypothetical protein